MSSFGHYCIFVAHALAVWGVIASVAALATKDRRYLDSALNAIYAIAGFTVLATGALITAILRDDFTIKYVWEYSRRTQPLIYKLTALWGGMSGSLLFWAVLLAIFSALAVTFNRRANLRILPFACLVLLASLGFSPRPSTRVASRMARPVSGSTRGSNGLTLNVSRKRKNPSEARSTRHAKGRG
jgi:cytochrome c-type biogenesis protein CcmF